MESIALYGKLAWVAIRSQMQYRASFVLMMIGNLLAALTEFIGVWAFFDRFDRLGSWTLHEVAVFYGIINISFAICEGFTRGFDMFHRHVRTGEFDRVLLRPRAAALQVLGSECQLTRIGRMAQGAAILSWGLHGLGLSWGFSHWLLLIWAILGGVMLFSGIIIFQATSSFWTIESIEIWNTTTYGGVYALQYPIDIYKGFLRRFFTFIVPLAAINYFPCSYLLDKGYVSTAASFFAPLLGVVFVGLGLLFWRFGIQHYRSTGS